MTLTYCLVDIKFESLSRDDLDVKVALAQAEPQLKSANRTLHSYDVNN